MLKNNVYMKDSVWSYSLEDTRAWKSQNDVTIRQPLTTVSIRKFITWFTPLTTMFLAYLGHYSASSLRYH